MDKNSQDFLLGLREEITSGGNPDFQSTALALYRIHRDYNPVYRRFLSLTNRMDEQPDSPGSIPFLPIGFFKSHRVTLRGLEIEREFHSSGTSSMQRAVHHIHDTNLYRATLLRGFKEQVGDPAEYCFLATLPGYTERKESSLLLMLQELMNQSGDKEDCGFFYKDYDALEAKIGELKTRKVPIVLFGVTFSLLDFAEKKRGCSGLTIIETGGMKGRESSMSKAEMYEFLEGQLGDVEILSEYGMTELLSQSYGQAGGRLRTTEILRVYPGDLYDPFAERAYGKTARLQFIDLANMYSCPFIASDDLAMISNEREFRILGRVQNSDLRGCQLLIEDMGE